ncbi:MAG: hypothetical protein EBS13_00660 [Verrucomicrobia bacterium]|jgi:hypothetical protein|nr:hypothetical protein [Verrucomicrobiota bacterium]
MRKKILLFLSTLLTLSVSAQKETILLRKIDATNTVKSTRPQSLSSYLESLPTHFINYLNQTGKYAVIDLSSVFSESNLDLELENSAVFEAADKKLLKKPKYILNCSVTAFVEKQVNIKNPLDDSTRINRDIFVSVTMQLINRENPADQKTFQVPDFSDAWDEDQFGSGSGGDLVRIQKVENFAKASAEQMASSFVSSFEQKIYVYQKTGTQCTILAGYKNGIEVNQVYNVGIAKPIIHPITKQVMTGTTFTKIGVIKVVSTQADVATCEIIEDLGINTDVEPDKLPLARLATQ